MSTYQVRLTVAHFVAVRSGQSRTRGVLDGMRARFPPGLFESNGDRLGASRVYKSVYSTILCLVVEDSFSPLSLVWPAYTADPYVLDNLRTLL